ncbi:MAG: CPBP family intramembrane glutamic endopeptidase [Dermatophilaceae bacterium]
MAIDAVAADRRRMATDSSNITTSTHRSRPQRLLLFVGLTVLVAGTIIGSSGLQDTLGLPFRMNWVMQAAILIAGLFLLFAFRRWIPRTGLRLPDTPWLVVVVVCVAACLAVFVPIDFIVSGSAVERPGLEEFAFQATMPGLAEEVAFRGALLGVLLPAFSSTRTVVGMPVNAAILLQALPFAILHLPDGLTAGLVTFALGVILGSLRVKFDSLIPCIIFHNLYNVSVYVVVYISAI